MKSHIYIYTTMFVVMLSVVPICKAVQPTTVTTGPNGFVTTEDGVILISQSKKTTFPIIISQPGSYRLSTNLTVPINTIGIEIQADNVTLDLNGFQITTDPSGDAGIGISDLGSNHPGITVRNGIIQNFCQAITLSSSGSDIEKIHARNNACIFSEEGPIPAGISVGNNSIVTGNIATENGAFGIQVGDNSTITGNIASSNLGNGLIVGKNSTVTGNTASNNGLDGIFASCPTNLVGNTAQNNGLNGIIGSEDNIATSGTGCTLANNNPAP